MEGTVKFFNRRKGFGFITGDDGKDYFVHFTALKQGTFLRDNDKVTFEAVEGDKGLKADQVALLTKASDRTDLPAEAREGKKSQPKEEYQEENVEEEDTQEVEQ